jgi:hypothetical protein
LKASFLKKKRETEKNKITFYSACDKKTIQLYDFNEDLQFPYMQKESQKKWPLLYSILLYNNKYNIS